MDILFIAAECAPYAKTGGLADVVGALPQYLRAMGHEAIVVMPRYSSINGDRYGLRWFHGPMGVWMGNTQEWCAVHTASSGGVPVYFIESQKYFDRWGLYHDANFNDYQDNPRRFGFLTRAGLQLCKDIGFKPDVVHAHDWHTALAPAYLKIWHWNDPLLGSAASLLTIHNIAYQGRYPAYHMDYLGLQWGNFTPDKFEDHGAINFLKGGIVYADMVNTVSPTYARETRTPELGYGMAPYLNAKGENYIGILNGCDYALWNPQTDPLIPARYTCDDLSGKAACKRALQQRFGLTVSPDTPVIGIVSRMVEQKGLHLLAQCIEDIVANMRVQFAILGSGEKALEHYFGELPARYPGRIGSYIGYSDELAHWIEAGSDFFLMPSLFEPCGLNQMYSLRYGTLPIVRATGGLDDTVQQYDEATGDGTGFKFYEASAHAIYYTVGWAVSTYYDRPQHMQRMIHTAMAQDFSWERSAEQYVRAYERAIQNKRGG
ncbi:MAG: glycogen synthase GlgA [Chloroflexi bacterium]|jgi:starch synthase|uniref:Glycogen synthase n=1 Tax=Candidatus Thermofonsia Clade 3 bacterium TaxID=2364212 RepID=A0A2M8QFA1_9CHLR|nr:glycogen synthase GlgA [Candidatus Roseilinea sp. NK_OTU-006]PJF48495.1 MAG: glycogen synthase GlgA [Candidatus Thermofonsia Clade 3 bacterium]RMG66089.1 MAG: glycogen synthase GlgA [Chloroflexota bacterium]